MQRRAAVLKLVAAAFLWSLGGLLIKWVDWHPMAISGMRSAIAGAFLLLVCRRLKFAWSPYLLGGAVAYACTVTLFVLANKLTTAANAILLQYTAPVHVALFGAWFLGERPGRRDWLTLVVVLSGMALFFLEDLTLAHFWGNLAALGSGFAFAWIAIFLRRREGGPSSRSSRNRQCRRRLPFMPSFPDAGLDGSPARRAQSASPMRSSPVPSGRSRRWKLSSSLPSNRFSIPCGSCSCSVKSPGRWPSSAAP
jgi:uncharacterized membrane protein